MDKRLLIRLRPAGALDPATSDASTINHIKNMKYIPEFFN